MNLNKLAVLLTISLFNANVSALESDFNQPINVSSVEQFASLKTNTIVFTKEVLLTQGSIKITADKLTIIRGKKANHETMIAEGNDATFYQTQADGRPLDAKAKRIVYDVESGKITLTTSAQVKQLDSQVNGAKIVYFLDSQELNVSTDENKKERVKTIFLPAQFEKDKTQSKSSSTKAEK
jgi:lipopolysaccharide export system protein LptA